MRLRAFIQTYGCQMNEHDSQRMAEILAAEGYDITGDIEEADLILVNTCSVRKNPENKVYSFVGSLERLKRRNPRLIIGVAGCVARQQGEALLKRTPLIDLVFGPDNYFQLPDMLASVREGRRVAQTEWTVLPGDDGAARGGNFIPDEWVERGHVDGVSAYVAIMKGCNNFCSFCIVPHVRGREVSRAPESILREVADLAGKGAKEIWLLGQNVNSYRHGDTRFPELLAAVSDLPVSRIRFTSPHPKDWTNDLADLMAARPNICNHLHLPFQAGSNRILERMNRRHTIETYLDKLAYLRKAVSGVEFGTDLIVGFPGESEEDFQETLRVMDTVRFSQVFSFKYSPRPGTKAEQMPDDVPRAVKEERLRRVIQLQERITSKDMAAYVGTEQEVLIDGTHPKREGVLRGRTGGNRPVSIENSAFAIGDIVRVTITSARGHWLTANLKSAK